MTWRANLLPKIPLTPALSPVRGRGEREGAMGSYLECLDNAPMREIKTSWTLAFAGVTTLETFKNPSIPNRFFW